MKLLASIIDEKVASIDAIDTSDNEESSVNESHAGDHSDASTEEDKSRLLVVRNFPTSSNITASKAKDFKEPYSARGDAILKRIATDNIAISSVAQIFAESLDDFQNLSKNEVAINMRENNQVHVYRTDTGKKVYWRRDGFKWRFGFIKQHSYNEKTLTVRVFQNCNDPWFEKIEYNLGIGHLSEHFLWEVPLVLVQYRKRSPLLCPALTLEK